MNIKHYYIVPRDVAIAGALHHYTHFHYLDLDDTHVLLSVSHRSDHEQENWERNIAAEPLPHVFDPTPISDEHIARLHKHERLKVLGLKKGHTTRDLAALLRKQQRQM